MNLWTGSTLIQKMVCYPFGAKPFRKPMITSHQSHPEEQTSMKRWSKLPISVEEIALEVIVCNFAILQMSRGLARSRRAFWNLIVKWSNPEECEHIYHIHLKNILTHWGRVTPFGGIDLGQIGSGNGLLPDGTKPLPETMLTYHQ